VIAIAVEKIYPARRVFNFRLPHRVVMTSLKEPVRPFQSSQFALLVCGRLYDRAIQ
jgi:hypothetical protein